ncbi:hypothetical protein Ahy_A10g049493 isoform E [Arachis hypogaea]|uniref:SANTA domain-containing protein n=1 Tax=Arachis hypogaea TaxID=3818 RepID=A0A445B7A1_ARAHY|nr:hypothetical protein Ahy_A10g049493 isoform E [Arachis hypogaea]
MVLYCFLVTKTLSDDDTTSGCEVRRRFSALFSQGCCPRSSSSSLPPSTKSNGDFTISHISHSCLSLLPLHPLLTMPIYLVSNQRHFGDLLKLLWSNVFLEICNMVFNNFLFGFPQNWESYAADLIRDESNIGTDLGSAVPKTVSSIDLEIFSAEKSILSSSKPLKEAFGAHGKPHAEVEWHDSNATCGVNAAQGSGSIRHVTRFHNMKVCQQKQPASGISLKHPEELNSPVTPV